MCRLLVVSATGTRPAVSALVFILFFSFLDFIFFSSFQRNCNKKPAISRVIMTFVSLSFSSLFKEGERKKKKRVKSILFISYFVNQFKALQGEE
jgi:hypothetical protein